MRRASWQCAGLLAGYVMATLVDRRMESVFSGFWYPKQKELRDGLKQARQLAHETGARERRAAVGTVRMTERSSNEAARLRYLRHLPGGTRRREMVRLFDILGQPLRWPDGGTWRPQSLIPNPQSLTPNP